MSTFQKMPSKPTLQDSIAKLEEIQLGFRQNLLRLHETLAALEDDTDLLSDMDILKRDVEAKAHGLEEEVKRLREDIRSIKDLLGADLKNNNGINSH